MHAYKRSLVCTLASFSVFSLLGAMPVTQAKGESSSGCICISILGNAVKKQLRYLC